MKFECTEVAKCRQKITVEVPAEKVDAAFDELYNELRDNAQVKGFRKGHTPRKLLEKKFSKVAANDVRSKLFQDSFLECLKENDISPLGDPDLKVEDLEAKPGEPFGYTTEVDVRPKFELPEYKKLALTEKVVPVTDAEIDEQLGKMRQAFAEYNPTEEACAENDMLEVDVVAKAGEEEIVNETGQRLRVSGEMLFGMECKELVKTLVGAKAGTEKKIELTLPDTFYKEELRGQKAKISLKVNQVLKAELPEVNQQFAQKFGIETVDELKSRIRGNIEAERSTESRRELEEAAKAALLEKVSFDLPEEFLKRQINTNLMRSKMQMARMGATKEFLGEKAAELEKSTAENTEKDIRWMIVSDAIADKEEFEVTEQEIQRHLEMLANYYRTTPAKMFKQIQESNGLAAMISEIRDIKVLNCIMNEAEITKAEVAG
jgi:trigger factor